MRLMADARHRNWLGYAALAGGAVVVGAAIWKLYNHGSLLGRATPKGRVVEHLAPPAPMVSRTKADGMTLTHYRSKDMPIEQRVRHIQDLVWKSIHDPRMRKIALQATHHCPERDGLCEAKAIYKAVKQRVRYTGDIAPVRAPDGSVEGIDMFSSAYRTWELRGEDCDSHTILNATMLALNGIEPRLRVTAPSRRGEWAHIYALAGFPKNTPRKWLALDTTLPGKNQFGVEVPFGKNLDFKTKFKDYPA